MAEPDSSAMTRQQYRDSLARAQADNEEQPNSEAAEEPTSAENSRAAYAAESAQNIEEQKIKRLAHKLNWAILGLTLAIIIVFLILFFTP